MSDEPFFKSAKFWRTVVLLFLVVGFLVGFGYQVFLVCKLVFLWLVNLVIKPVFVPSDPETKEAVAVVGANLLAFILVYLGAMLWMSQFTLPVQRFFDRLMVFWRMLLYNIPFIHLHGPAVFVKEGKSAATEEELSNTKAGIASVDQYSAVVLEHEKKSTVRASGAGITFTHRGEKMIGFVDIRKQSRSRKDVACNTGDGIEVTTNVSISFTLGQPPDIIKVTKVKNNWLVVKVTKDEQGNQMILELSNELDEKDQEEVDEFFRKNSIGWTVGGSESEKAPGENPLPFEFDAERVKSAVYSRARNANVKEGRIGDWTELPLDVAVDVFRNKSARQLYDELYLPEDPEKYPMEKFKADFGSAVQNMGILNYQIVVRTDGQPIEKGQPYNESELFFSPSQTFKRSTVLRDHGIKVLSASFGNLVPTSDIIQKRFFDNWRAHWQQESDKKMAEYELEAMRIRNRERARAQQDMVYSLSHIFQTEQYASEALAVRLYEALEKAATQPTTQRLLPEDTVQMLHHLREWLLPDKQTKENQYDNEFLDGFAR